jgi:alpha-beta hydrolase superfamily lysophospholipase
VTDLHLVNVWTDPDNAPGGFNPMVASLLWQPEEYSPGHPTPAFIFVHDWGGYPYDSLAVQLCEGLAEKGFVALSLALRRRGMEGQLAAVPENDMRDIKLAVDHLHANGCRKIFLVGAGFGGVSAIRYAARRRDARVQGVTWLEPVPSPADWLRTAVGEDSYMAAVRTAGISARQGAGMDMRIDLFPDNGPAVTQNAMAFLSWWGPLADTRLEQDLSSSRFPLLLGPPIAAARKSLGLDEALANRAALSKVEVQPDASTIAAWAQAQGAELRAKPPLEMVRVASGSESIYESNSESSSATGRREYCGLLWTPADGKAVKTATLLMHGLTSSPLSPLFLQMAPVLAQTGMAVLAVEVQRSGWAGHENSVLDNDVDDLDVWISFLLERGYDKIVLAGASIGSISVGRYQSVRQHPNVVAIAHLMPTADCPDWFRRAAGDGPYAEAVKLAEAAIAAGRGAEELIDVDIRQPLPSLYGGRFRWTQRAASWLSWWGPAADSVNSVHIANAKVPLLLLSGTDDSYNDAARFAELRAAAVNAPGIEEIWYPDIDHGLAGVEEQVARDLLTWLKRIGVLE